MIVREVIFGRFQAASNKPLQLV